MVAKTLLLLPHGERHVNKIGNGRTLSRRAAAHARKRTRQVKPGRAQNKSGTKRATAVENDVRRRLSLNASGPLLLSVPRTAAPVPARTLLRPPPSRRAAHPDALQHPDPLLLIHLEGHPSGIGALGAAHDRRRAGLAATRAGSTVTRTTLLSGLRSSPGHRPATPRSIGC